MLTVEPAGEDDPQTKAWFLLVDQATKQGFVDDPDRYLQPDYIYTLQMAEEVCPHCGADP